MSLTQDVLGNTTTFSYDSSGNKITETDAQLYTTTLTYDVNGNVLTESRERTVSGALVTESTTFEYDELNRVTRVTDPLSGIIDTFYDGAGNQIAAVDALGRLTEFEYDAYGRLTETIYPDLSTELKTYDPEGNLLSDTDRLGRVTSFEYDALNRLIKTTFDDLSFTQTEYDAAGRVTAEIDARGNRTEFSYDAAGRRTSSTDALNRVTTFVYDADGNLTSQTDARTNTTGFVYNALDQRTQTDFDDSTMMLESYDALGRLLTSTDQAGVAIDYEYDSLGRLTAVVDALNQRTEYTYDEAGNKLTQRDANDHVTTWTYDALGRVLTRTLPLGQAESFTYAANGNVLTRIDFNGDVTTYEYDVNDRQTKITYQDLTEESFTYDAVGNRLTAADANGTISYQYDSRNRLTLETKPDGTTLAYSYDVAGNLIGLTTTMPTTSGPVSLVETHTYDVLNRLATSTDSGLNTTSYGYDEVGNRAGIIHPNGNATFYSYDGLNRLTQITVEDALTAVIDQFTYTLHPTGRREQIDELGGRSSSYVYDDLYRLTNEAVVDAVNGNYTASYSYDTVGNRTSSVINGITTGYSYDDNDRLLSAGGDSYAYDDNGNTVTKTESGVATTSVYDKRNKLVSNTSGGTTSSFDYDVDGLRISRSSGSNTTSFITDNNRDYTQVVAEVTNGEFAKGYSYGDDLISQVLPGGSVFFYHYDGLGSTRSLSDNTGTFTDEYDYEAFGELLNSSGSTDNDYLYTGEQYDNELDNYYLRARYYDQGIGRFTQMDNWVGIDIRPLSLNKFLYTESDSVNNMDPSGRFLIGASIGTNIRSILAASAVRAPTFLSQFNLGRGALAGTQAVAGICFAQAISSLASKNSLTSVIENKSGCQFNQVRVQLQQGSRRDRTIGKVAIWSANSGVSVNQVRGKLGELYFSRRLGNWFPSALDTWMYRSIVSLSIKLGQIPKAGGVSIVGNIFREEIFLKGLEYRVDIENLRGHNLRR